MAAPIRGTQSFVSVMSQVWRRPALTAFEIGWRWLAGVVLVLGSGWATRIRLTNFQDRAALLSGLTVFQPVIAIHNITAVAAEIYQGAAPLLLWLLPLAFFIWLLIAAFGRTLVLRRFDGALQPRRLTLFLLGTFRAILLFAVWSLWLGGVAWAARTAITGPAANNQEPSVVLFCALLIVGSLGLYVLWGIVSWLLYLAPLLAMRENLGPLAAIFVALKSTKALRGKLIEINLVLHIVRICLIVLAMVFSATPLPFSDVTSPTFLACWWSGVGLAYFAFSDYFHVVRSAAYLTLARAYEKSSPSPAHVA